MQPRRVLLIVDTPAALAHTLPLLNSLSQTGQFQVQLAVSPDAAAVMPLATWSALAGSPAKALADLSDADLQRAEAILLAPVAPELLSRLAGNGTLKHWMAAGQRPLLAAPVVAGNGEKASGFLPGLEILPSDNHSFFLGSLGQFSVAAPAYCLEALYAALTPDDLAGLTVLLTAGPTVEDADPARFVSNRSTGRMGAALALAAARRGASVTLVHGPMSWPVPEAPRIRALPVRSAQEMCDAVLQQAPTTDIAVLCAAVADYMPIAYSREKIKKGTESTFSLLLKRTPDILATLGSLSDKPFLVGFAAETQELEANAIGKLRQKNCDLLCANDITEAGSGFAVATNRLTVFYADGRKKELPQQSKEEIAKQVFDLIRQELPKE